MSASWQAIPPPPPPSPSPTPWYKRWWGVALIAVLAVGAASIALDDDEPAPVAQEETETVESETAPPPEPEPEPEPAPTSDWPDENTYALELLTGLEATIQILGVTTDASDAYPSLTNMELATVTTEAQA